MLRTVGLFLVTAAAMSATSAHALECPELSATRIAGLDDTANEKVLSGLRGVINGQSELPAIVAFVRSQSPGVGAAAVTNYLIGAYCPMIAARSDIDETAKARAVETFAAQVSKLLY
jgi:hypothetical protein